MTMAAPPRSLIVACGALAREIGAIVKLNKLDGVDVEYLPGRLHNKPDEIPERVRARIRAARSEYDQILVGYADCGTGGRLDKVCEEEGAIRMPGPHCYEIYAGPADFNTMADEHPGTFYLTDYMVRYFDIIVWRGLGLDRHSQLLETYFGNYTRVVHLAHDDDPDLFVAAQEQADRLGLTYERHDCGYGDLEPLVVNFVRSRGPELQTTGDNLQGKQIPNDRDNPQFSH